MKFALSRPFSVLLPLMAILLASCATAPPQGTQEPPASPIAEATPRDAEALWQKAETEFKTGKVPTAIALWERIVQQYPRNMISARALHRVGTIYLDQGQPERALQYYDYLIYTYPRWDAVQQAQLDRLRALSMTGRKKQAMKEAPALWEASAGRPEVQVGLSRLMAGLYGAEGDLEEALQWLAAGIPLARTPEEKRVLSQTALEVLKGRDEGTLKKLLKRNAADPTRIYIEFQLAQLEMQQGKADTAKERLRVLLAQNPGHPLAPQIQAAMRGAVVDTVAVSGLPLNSDRIGALLPVNGPNAKYGELVLRGLTLATTEWNERHSNERISLVVKDAQTDPQQAKRSLEELARKDGVLAVVGPLGSPTTKAVAPLADQLGMPLLTLTQKEEDSADDSYVFYVFLDYEKMVHRLVKYCRERLGYTKFAALYPDDRYGQKLSKDFSESVREMGGEMLASVSYKEKSTDFKDAIQKLLTIAKKNQPPSGTDATPFEALFIPDQVQTVSLIAPQLPYNNVVGVTLLGTNLWGEGPLVQSGGVYVEQAIFATPYLADAPSQHVRYFREKYEETYQATPSYLEAQAFDAMQMLLTARSTMPSAADRSALVQSLLQIQRFEGVAGTYSFSPSGDLERTYQLYQVINGQLQPLTP